MVNKCIVAGCSKYIVVIRMIPCLQGSGKSRCSGAEWKATEHSYVNSVLLFILQDCNLLLYILMKILIVTKAGKVGYDIIFPNSNI